MSDKLGYLLIPKPSPHLPFMPPLPGIPSPFQSDSIPHLCLHIALGFVICQVG